MMQKIKDFFKEVKIEFAKVAFPTREELVGSTWVVIVSVFAVSIYLGAIDIVLSKVIEGLLK